MFEHNTHEEGACLRVFMFPKKVPLESSAWTDRWMDGRTDVYSDLWGKISVVSQNFSWDF